MREYQYYWHDDQCEANYAHEPNCICWHNEGSGPYKKEQHDSDIPLVDWRIKHSDMAAPGVSDEVFSV